MRVIEIAGAGGPEVLRLAERPQPQAQPGEVLIAVAAAGLNGADLAQRQGHYPPPPGASDIPGLEVSGTIAGLGDGVTGFAIGDRVCALLTGGGYSQFVAAPQGQVLKLPPALDLIAAGGLIETAATVWANVFEAARLAAGETLLVHGGSSGIGTTAIQMAKAMGARVLVTAGTDAKCQACLALGAERAINYKTEDFSAAVLDATEGGADVILDMVGGAYLEPNLRTLATGGRLAIIALKGGRMGQLDIGRLMSKRLQVTGSTLRARPVADKARILQQVRQNVWPLLESGAVRPIIDTVYALEDAAKAHAYMERGDHIGKLVLTLG